MTATRNPLPYQVFGAAVLVTSAAMLQEACGPWFWGLAKPPFLLAVATYYALLRPLPLAVPAVFCAGAWADGLGTVPFPATLVAALLLVAFCAVRGRAVLNRTPLCCAWLGAIAALATLLLQAVALFRAGLLHEPAGMIAGRLAAGALLALPVSLATAWTARAFERATGNIPPPEEEGDVAP